MIKTLVIICVCTVACIASAAEVPEKTDSRKTDLIYPNIKTNINTKKQGMIEPEYDASKITHQGRTAQANNAFLEGRLTEEEKVWRESEYEVKEKQQRDYEAHDSMPQMLNNMMFEVRHQEHQSRYNEYMKQNVNNNHGVVQ